MKNFKKIFSLILVSSLLLVACGDKAPKENANTLEKIQASKKIKIGITADYPPYEFYTFEDGQEKLAGMDIELSNYIGEKLGAEVEFVNMEFSNLLTSLSLGKVDMIISGMNPTAEREEQVDFSDIYHKASFSLVYRENEEAIKSLEDLKGKTVGVQMGTTQEKAISEVDGVNVSSLSKNPDIIMNIKTNKIDYGIMEGPVASSFVKANEGIAIVEDLPIGEEADGMSIAVKKNNSELIEKLNEIIKDIDSKDLMDKWFIEADEKAKSNL